MRYAKTIQAIQKARASVSGVLYAQQDRAKERVKDEADEDLRDQAENAKSDYSQYRDYYKYLRRNYRPMTKQEIDEHTNRAIKKFKRKVENKKLEFLEKVRRPFEQATDKYTSPDLSAATAVLTQLLQSLPKEQEETVRNSQYFGDLVQFLDQKKSQQDYGPIMKRAKALFDWLSSYGAGQLEKQKQKIYQRMTGELPGAAHFDIPDREKTGLSPDTFWIRSDPRTNTPQLGFTWVEEF